MIKFIKKEPQSKPKVLKTTPKKSSVPEHLINKRDSAKNMTYLDLK